MREKLSGVFMRLRAGKILFKGCGSRQQQLWLLTGN